ncbi:MAG: sigma-70 family RNA polymerase sigma factor [Chloroflexi bacterium]|nr:sigma-70 family RNA polymerase sigma factor [Chloroflexota bacterium]
MGYVLPQYRDQAEPNRQTDLQFEAAYTRYYAQICGYLQRMIDNVDDAQDLATSTFEKAYRSWSRAPQDNLLPWLYRIATNTCLDELRRRRLVRWQPLDSFVALFHPKQVARDNPERDAIRSEQKALVRQALDQLSARQRAALLMRECEGLSCEQIGEVLGVSKEAAKQLLFRARQQLKVQYLALGGEPLDG